MPTLLMKDGFKFFIYANEHMSKHIHVTKGGDYAKIDLETLAVIEIFFSKSEMITVLEIASENRELFMRKWNEFFRR